MVWLTKAVKSEKIKCRVCRVKMEMCDNNTVSERYDTAVQRRTSTAHNATHFFDFLILANILPSKVPSKSVHDRFSISKKHNSVSR